MHQPSSDSLGNLDISITRCFQEALRQELIEFKYSPAQLLSAEEAQADSIRSHPSKNFELLDTEIDEATRILSNPKASIFAMGGIWSYPAALHFTNSMQRVRSHCFTISKDDLAPAIVNADKNSVFVVFDFRQYTSELFAGMRLALERNATVLLITDRWVSPVAAFSKVLLPVDIEHPPFDSLVAPIALAETLTERVRHSLGTKQEKRIKELYLIYEAIGVLPNGESAELRSRGPGAE